MKRFQEYHTSWHASQYPSSHSKRVVWCLCVCERETPKESWWQRAKEKEWGSANASERKRGGERIQERKRVRMSTYHHPSCSCPSHYLCYSTVIIYCAAGIFFWWNVKIGQTDLRFEPSPQPPHPYRDNVSCSQYPARERLWTFRTAWRQICSEQFSVPCMFWNLRTHSKFVREKKILNLSPLKRIVVTKKLE